MEENYTLTIQNKRLYDFYNSNKHIDIEAINLVFLDLIEKIHYGMSNTLTQTINSEILSSVKEIKNNVSVITNTLIIKFHEINKEYIDNMKLIISSSSTDSMDKLLTTLEKNTETFVAKVNNEIPKTHHEMNTKIKENLQSFQVSIIEDIKGQLFQVIGNESALREYISSIDAKIQGLQQPLYSFITANQDQITSNLNNLKESNILHQLTQNKIMEELGDFLNKYRTNSNYKGKSSEHMLEGILNKMYPTAEIVNSSSSLKLAGDFILKREGKAHILIENKNYDLAIQKEGVEKFLRDVKAQKCHGIFMSQYSGIQYKPNYFIEIDDGCVLIYLHNVDYSEEKIRTAVDIIDNLSSKLYELNINDEDGVMIKKDVLDKINAEFQVFINHKELLAFNLKEFQKSFLQQIEELKLPDLTVYLNSKYASMQNQKWSCEICNEAFTKKASLASHMKKHKTEKNESPKNSIVCLDDMDNIKTVIEPLLDTDTATMKKKKKNNI